MIEPVDYSLVICTYNPDEISLRRCLEAVYKLDKTGLRTEVILVDNNSSVPVNGLAYVREYLERIPNMYYIMVAEQGVGYARIAAIKKALGEYIVYFDYDNEPAVNYLQELKKLNFQYPIVAAWGPGDITVDFLDGVEENIKDYARGAFQERHQADLIFDNKHDWQPFYPFGTGLCTKSFLLKEYVHLSESGVYTFSGRKGKQLTSGEDTQMLLHCIKMGYAAGSSPSLKLVHMIPKWKSNAHYLKRLIYGTFLCYDSCLLQVFPDRKTSLEKKMIPGALLSRLVLKKYMVARFSNNPLKEFNLVQFIASACGVYLSLGKRVPYLIKKISVILKVE